jgi:hypothetical protein
MAVNLRNLNFFIDAGDGSLVRQPDGSYLLLWISGEEIKG